MADNPLLEPWSDPLGLPPFGGLKPEHFRPAFEAEMANQLAAIEAIVASPEPPTFDNTIVPLELSGIALERVGGAFFHLAGADTNEALQAVEREISPLLARHADRIYLNATLYGRITSIWAGRSSLGDEEARVADRYHTIFVRAGAALDETGKQKLAAINERLAAIGTAFAQNVLADESGWTLVLDTAEDRAGLPDWLLSAASAAAE